MDARVDAPPAEEIVPGIFRVSLPLPWSIRQINCYLVQHGSTCTIIDTGIHSAECIEALIGALRYLGIGLDRVEQIVVTHSHTDHIGLAGWIQDQTGATLILHRIEADLLIERFVEPGTPMRALQHFLSGYGVRAEHLEALIRHAGRDRSHYAPARPDRILQGGESIVAGESSLQVIWTPGHSPGHCCYYDVERRVLFAGDHVLPHLTPNVGRQAGPRHLEYPLLEYERSLRHLLTLDVALTLPGHGPMIPDLQARGAALLASHQRRRERCLDAVRAGHDTLEAIASSVFRGARDGWAQRGALIETLAHLDALVVEGQLISETVDGIRRFAIAPLLPAGQAAGDLSQRTERPLDQDRAGEDHREADERDDAVELEGHE